MIVTAFVTPTRQQQRTLAIAQVILHTISV